MILINQKRNDLRIIFDKIESLSRTQKTPLEAESLTGWPLGLFGPCLKVDLVGKLGELAGIEGRLFARF